MDVTSDTVDADKLLSGETATKNDGTKVTGTFVAPDPVISSLTVTPTESQQTFNELAISGYKPVTVGAIPSNYIGSAIPMRSSADASFYTEPYGGVFIPSGYYSSNINEAPTIGATPTVSISITSSTAAITATAANTGSSGFWMRSGASTYRGITLPSLPAKTYIPGSTSQIINSYQWLTGDQVIEAIPSSYVIPSGTYSVTENGTYDITHYASVDVNVAGGGGFTVDQIAMRSISGDISGNASIIDNYAFYHCSDLTTVNFPSCTMIGNYAFQNCSNLTTANFPSCTTIGNSAFYSCTSLTTASFPSCTMIKNHAFYGCTSLTAASFPSCTMIGNYAFAYCFNLTTVSFPSCTTIGSATFYRCFNLLSIYLLGSSITSITSTTFDSTPIAGYTTSTGGAYGSIFVPASLYDSYLTEIYWSKYTDRIVSV